MYVPNLFKIMRLERTLLALQKGNQPYELLTSKVHSAIEYNLTSCGQIIHAIHKLLT